MKIEQARWTAGNGWGPEKPGRLGRTAQLALVFGGGGVLKSSERLAEIRRLYPKAVVFGCSTSGEILGTEVHDDTLALTAVDFEKATIKGTKTEVRGPQDSLQAGRRIASALEHAGLVHVLVLSNGIGINGSALVEGLTQGLPKGIAVTGGMAGDGARFTETCVIWDGVAQSGTVAAVGFYGDRLTVGYGSLGGWDSFGPERLITRSTGNVLFELDGKSALELYKNYLGDHARGLPASGLLYPLTMRSRGSETGVVRTILSVDEERRSMTFAGNVIEGSYVRLMKANFDRLIDGAVGAAKTSKVALGVKAPELAILISCVGRKMVLQQRVEEEVEGVRDVLGQGAALTGFYSYGEISPFTPNARCELHNQTMTITAFREG